MILAIIIGVLIAMVVQSERDGDPARATATMSQRRAWRRDRLDLNRAFRGRWS